MTARPPSGGSRDEPVDPSALTPAGRRCMIAAPGTEAFAGTSFTVLTPGGDTIREAIGAFPQVTLAEGEYQLIARHDGKVYTQDFKVESGLDRDIEAIAKDP